jgi:hypothetical protein
MAFDDSPEGELKWRYRLATGRELNRTIATYDKVRREALAADDGETPVFGDLIGPELLPDAAPVCGDLVPTSDAIVVEPMVCAESSSTRPAFRRNVRLASGVAKRTRIPRVQPPRPTSWRAWWSTSRSPSSGGIRSHRSIRLSSRP